LTGTQDGHIIQKMKAERGIVFSHKQKVLSDSASMRQADRVDADLTFAPGCHSRLGRDGILLSEIQYNGADPDGLPNLPDSFR